MMSSSSSCMDLRSHISFPSSSCYSLPVVVIVHHHRTPLFCFYNRNNSFLPLRCFYNRNNSLPLRCTHFVQQEAAKSDSDDDFDVDALEEEAKLAALEYSLSLSRDLVIEDEVIDRKEVRGRQRTGRNSSTNVPDSLLPKVSIVGRPNVGKSALFNRLVGGNKAIVVDEPGVTRDRLYGRSFWGDYEFLVIDTGGVLTISQTPDNILEELAVTTTIGMEGIPLITREAAVARMPSMIEKQATIAVEESSVIIFLVDGQAGLNAADVEIANWLRKNYSNKYVILAVNKCESPRKGILQVSEFWSLGYQPIPISALSGTGTGELLDLVCSGLVKVEGSIDPPEGVLRIELPEGLPLVDEGCRELVPVTAVATDVLATRVYTMLTTTSVSAILADISIAPATQVRPMPTVRIVLKPADTPAVSTVEVLLKGPLTLKERKVLVASQAKAKRPPVPEAQLPPRMQVPEAQGSPVASPVASHTVDEGAGSEDLPAGSSCPVGEPARSFETRHELIQDLHLLEPHLAGELADARTAVLVHGWMTSAMLVTSFLLG